MNQQPEPAFTINGVPLNKAQAMTLRVAIEAFDPDCGDDALGLAIADGYRSRLREIRHFMYESPLLVEQQNKP